MAKLIEPIGRVVGGAYDGSFIYWLIDKEQNEYFAISPRNRLRIGMFTTIEDNPITLELHQGDVVRTELKDEAFLHEDVAVYTKQRGKILMRMNRQASEKIRNM